MSTARHPSHRVSFFHASHTSGEAIKVRGHIPVLIHMTIFSPEYRGSYSNFEGVRVRAPFGELEGNRAGTVAVQAIACTDKVRQDVDVAGSLRVAVNRLAVSTSEHMFVLRRSKISFLSVFEQRLRTDLAIIQRRL
jgi:hypothetical protein